MFVRIYARNSEKLLYLNLPSLHSANALPDSKELASIFNLANWVITVGA